MHKLLLSMTKRPSVHQPVVKRGHNFPLVALLGAVLTLGYGFNPQLVRAESPETAPAELKATLTQIDTAATKQNLQGVLQYYSPNFANSDGLTRPTLEQALTQLWKRYPTLTYTTEITSWKKEGSGITAETSTRIVGTQKVSNREYKLDSTLRARQTFENQKIISQEILGERSQIKSGVNPPNVLLNLPEEVKQGQAFNFDAIVQEPIGNDLLLGTALEEPVKPDGYINPTTADLELLSSGGIFKVGRAPAIPGSRWLSAVLVRYDGITIVTQRLRVVGGK
jgi:hypothetical protein